MPPVVGLCDLDYSQASSSWADSGATLRLGCIQYRCASDSSPRASQREFFSALSTADVWLSAHQDLRPE